MKGRARNNPDPYRPGEKLKNNRNNPPDSGYRSRSWHIDGSKAISCSKIPKGLHYKETKGEVFLRVNAGAYVGIQASVSKQISGDVDLTSGWDISGSVSGGVYGAAIDFGGGGSISFTYR